MDPCQPPSSALRGELVLAPSLNKWRWVQLADGLGQRIELDETKTMSITNFINRVDRSKSAGNEEPT